ncbi:EpsG family protein [Photobacterium carnosum]|uniref:EpsG family protein n=1 Tax=Photobacterium carnosum TaxID=2023717 RepID=UPI001E31FFC1|nr:EpsG family protein [Photobacterium carnosum]MCD9526049.1 hypothetical protein [Photobacterium carnosum]
MITEYSALFILSFSLLVLLISIFTIMVSDKAISLILAFTTVICYVVIFGLRDYSIGSDTSAYVENFLYGNWDFELLFTALTNLIRVFTKDPTNYLLILSLILGFNIFLAYYLVSKKLGMEKYILIFLWLALFSQGMLTGTINLFRQSLGFSFFLVGFAFYVKDEKFNVISIVFILCSGLIHNSNFLLIILFILSSKFSYKFVFFAIVISFIIFFGHINEFILDKFGSYHIIQRTLARHLYFNERRSVFTIYLNIIYCLLNYLFFYFYSVKNKKYFELNKISNIYGLILALSIFMSFNREMALRFFILCHYIAPLAYLCIYKKEKSKLILMISISLLILLYLLYLLSRPWFVNQFLGHIIS